VNDYMLGMIALGIVIVDAPAGDPAAFSQAQLQNALLEIHLGIELLNLLAVQFTPNQRRAFSYLVQVERVQISPTAGLQPPTGGKAGATQAAKAAIIDQEIDDREPHWRDPALQALGLSRGPAGIQQHNQALLNRSWPGGLKARWAYTVFITRYAAGWMAYSDRGLGRTVLQFDWLEDTSGNFNGTQAPGFGPFGIDRVFAHETGHIFGAPDEYSDSQCAVTDTRSKPTLANGFTLTVPNANCELNNSASVKCLMKKNDPVLCPSTVAAFGWVDLDTDGVLDFLGPHVMDVSPNSGPPGTPVTVKGVGLAGAKAVGFGGFPATTFTVQSDNEIDVISPNGTGAVDITVTTSTGASAQVAGVTGYQFP
jgi:IPT/TIG domain-containing protein